jgi:glycosyltransferase involved in cell wall biosynthesis
VATSADRSAVSVVVPAYQEADSIAPALRRLVGVLEGTGRRYEVVVVSDGSTDGTAEIARGLALPHVEVVDYRPNRGKGHALRTGFLRTAYPVVAFIDGDLDLDPVVLPGWFDRIDADEADVVVGSKVHPESAVQYPPTRRLASRLFRLATRIALGLDLGDTQTGVKAMRRSVAAEPIAGCTSAGFAFDLDLLSRIVEGGAVVVEAPVVLDYAFSTTVGAGSVVEALRDLTKVARQHRARVAARRARVRVP